MFDEDIRFNSFIKIYSEICEIIFSFCFFDKTSKEIIQFVYDE